MHMRSLDHCCAGMRGALDRKCGNLECICSVEMRPAYRMYSEDLTSGIKLARMILVDSDWTLNDAG